MGFRRTWPLLAVLALAALVLRFLPVAQVFREDGIHFYDSDSYYHLRRMLLCVEHFPRVPVHDPWQNYPDGGVTMWPPLHDAAIVAVARLVDGARPSDAVVERVAAVAPPVLGALAIVPLALLAGRLAGPRVGVLAGALLAIQPAHVLYSAVGRPDQHVSEILLSTLLFGAVLSLPALRAPPGSPARATRRAAWMAAGALAGAAAVLVWMGSILFHVAVVAFLALAFALRLDARRPPPAALVFEGAGLAALAALAAAAGSAYLLAGQETTPTYVSFSWFQAHFCVLASLGLAAWGAVVVGVREGRGAALRAAGPWLLVLGVLALALVPTGLDQTLTTALRGVRHVSKTSSLVHATDASHHVLSYNQLWLRGIAEYAPLLYPGGTFDPWRYAMRYLGPVLFVLPLVALHLLVRRRGPPLEARLFVPVWLAASGWMALSQVKYVYLAAPLAAFATADLLVGAADRALALRRPSARGAALAGVAVLTAVLLGPGLRYLARFNASYVDLAAHEVRAFRTLRHVTPDAGSFLDAEVVPRYGVLAFWDRGNYLQYLARRPVVANNNGYGFEDSLEFFFAETEDAALGVLERRRVRYVVLTDVTAELATLWDQLHGTLAPYFSADVRRVLTVHDPFVALVQSRLFFEDGAAVRAGEEPLARFRLVWEEDGPPRRLRPAPPGNRAVAPVKVFEVVAGARIRGGGHVPGEPVVLTTEVHTNLGRAFVEVRRTTVASDGTFELRTPYADGDGTSVRVGARTIAVGRAAPLPVAVPEAAVQGGGVLVVGDGAAAASAPGARATDAAP